MSKLIDRWMQRAVYPGSYSDQYYTGAEYAPGYAADGGRKEQPDQAIVRQARRAYKDNGIVAAVMIARQHLLAEARFQFQAMTDQHLFGNPDLTLLEHPWPNGQTGDLLARMCLDGSMGNSYYRKAIPAKGGDPVLVRLPQEKITIISEELRDDQGRVWKQPRGYAEDMGPERDPQIFTTDEVAHFAPLPDPNANWRGMSFLSPILREVKADNSLANYKTFHLDNGAMPGLVVKYSMKLSNASITKLRNRIRAKYGGPENAGNVLVLDEGADLTVAGSTLNELQFDAVTKAGERRICAAGGPGLLVITGLDHGDYKAAIREFADLWARPWWRMVCSSLEHLVPTSADVGPVRLWYDVAGIAALREGELERSQAFLVTMQGVASAVAAGFERKSAVKAAAANDVSLLVPDPNAPTPGMAGRVTESEKFGAPAGGPGQPPTGGPATGKGSPRPPQGGRPQQLPGKGSPNLPNALPGGFPAMPALPGGARGTGRRSAPLNGHGEQEPGDDG